MRILPRFKIAWLVLVVLFGCTKEESIETLEGKTIYTYPYGIGIPNLYYIKDLKTKKTQTFNAFPYVSHSGELVAMNVSFTSPSGIFVTDFFGEEKLFEYNIAAFPVTYVLWSPDDTKLALLSSDKNNIKIYDFVLKELTDLYLPGNEVWKQIIGWSGTDGFIYFTSQNNIKEISIGKIKPDGFGYQKIYKPGKNQTLGSSFDIHENTGLIVFSLLESDTISSNVNLCKIDTAGKGLHKLFSSFGIHAGWLSDINISPDGSKIAYVNGLDKIYIQNIDGTPFGFKWSNAFRPYWSKDGKSLMSSFRYDWDWNTQYWDIRIKPLESSKVDGFLVEKGPIYFCGWYFD